MSCTKSHLEMHKQLFSFITSSQKYHLFFKFMFVLSVMLSPSLCEDFNITIIISLHHSIILLSIIKRIVHQSSSYAIVWWVKNNACMHAQQKMSIMCE